MKTAEEWCDQWNTDNIDVPLDPKTVILIQADAIAYAAEMVHDISRGTKSEQRAIAIDEARDMLLSEARFLKRKTE